MKINKPIYLSALVALALTSCKTAQTSYLQDLSTLKPIESVDLPTRKSALVEADLQRWSHMDIVKDTVPGMSVDRAYEEIIQNKPGKKVIVAVIDSGIEVDHADLKPQMWVNPKEKVGNNKDNDKNGYANDIHGWNFLGDTNEEQLELTRIVSRGDDGSEQYKRAVKELEEKRKELEPAKQQLTMMQDAHDKIVKYLKKSDYNKEDLDKIGKDASADVAKAKNIGYMLISRGKPANDFLKEYADYVNGQLNYNLNTNFKGRKTNDDIFDIKDKIYGNSDVMGDRDHAKHGTHVAGIIAQTRHNNIGGDGVASNNVEIMSVRAVPDGDEYDKDVALAIRYAADNGAKVINGSFGKYFEQNSKWVQDAIKYAADKDVLIVVAAGNDAMDLNPANGEDVKRYPNDRIEGTNTEVADNFLVVGALNPSYGEKMVANFSNFGSKDVDVFAPGVKIYATTPHGKYEYLQGTSMASPNAAGVAAMIRSYYPKLSAAQVKQIMKDSGVAVNKQVIVSGDAKDKRNFTELSTSGKFVNLYNALILADKVAKGKK
ncbi:S8 family serine peptidase [Flavobacterium sp. xlx-214]|uniref:S8 family serine peptidase n=1 Tax=unclassified Flavobacterium TaxID=196869 RepID=UPI0013D78D01|nr:MULTISPECIES: S8 family serine peptidase [unclassified Flavobacterium]MBA5792067.1 S8 family serine peptidase [Flavobacterium sp. xlx-221]QMI84926.1 S8 family serine peptidase [Flavobacterium sp. xlx-214]